jgi:hypothetical protein
LEIAAEITKGRPERFPSLREIAAPAENLSLKGKDESINSFPGR